MSLPREGCEIRTFSPEFVDGVARVIVPIQQEEFGIAISYADQPDLQDIKGYYQKGTGEFWLAIADGEVVGTIALLDIRDGAAALRKMFVSRNHRGAQKGVASLLLRTLLEHARK